MKCEKCNSNKMKTNYHLAVINVILLAILFWAGWTLSEYSRMCPSYHIIMPECRMIPVVAEFFIFHALFTMYMFNNELERK